MQPCSQPFTLITSVKAPINVDCIKICPFNPKLFAFAYYQQGQTFLGGVSLQYFQEDKPEKMIEKFDIVEVGPVLHICWVNKIVQGKYLLIGASRSEKIFVFSVEEDLQNKNGAKIKLEKEIFIEKNVFCLYVDCFMRTQQSIEVIVSTNESQVFQLELSSSLDLIQTHTFSKHQYAIWTCRLNPFTTHTQFVCGDQVNCLYLYDNNHTLTAKNKIAHDQGICDLVFVSEHRLFTGGFDGVVNEIDVRQFAEKPKRTFRLGGTIWRVIPDNEVRRLLVCNSSEKKFQIIDSESGEEQWNSKNEHKSLAYSADWCGDVMLTSSFYDQLVCLWIRK